MAREIRKYYKDYNPETVFENTDRLEITRIIFYLKNEMLIFVDYSDEDNVSRVKSFLNEETDSLRVTDIYSAPAKRELYIPYESIKMAEINEGVVLTEEDFEMDNVEQTQAG